MLFLSSLGPCEVVLLPTKFRNKKESAYTNSMLLINQQSLLSLQLLSLEAKYSCYDPLRTADVGSYIIAFSRV